MYMSEFAQSRGHAPSRVTRRRKGILRRLVLGTFLLALPVWGQNPPADWQTQVRNYSELKDWAWPGTGCRRRTEGGAAGIPTGPEARSGKRRSAGRAEVCARRTQE